MAATKYTYSVATDTDNAAVVPRVLKKEIQDSAIVTALDYILVSGDVLDVWMKDALSAGDETTLDGLISNHQGVDTTAQVDPTLPEGAKEERLYASVSSYGSGTKDITPASGTIICFHRFGGSGAQSADIKVEVIWDADGTPEILFATHDSIEEISAEERTGDGTKKCRIKLTNDTAQSETFGAHYVYTEN